LVSFVLRPQGDDAIIQIFAVNRDRIRLSGDYNKIYLKKDYNSSSLEIFLNNRDYYHLQLANNFATSADNTYLTCDADVARAINGVGFQVIIL